MWHWKNKENFLHMEEKIIPDTHPATPEKKKMTPLRKKLLWAGGILLCLFLLLILTANILLLGKACHYPNPTLGLAQFRVLNKIMRQYTKARRVSKKNGIPLKKITLRFNEKETDALISIGEAYAKKQKDPLKWKADFLEEGKLEIRFSRHIAETGLALNGRVVLIPSCKDGILALEICRFELGRLSLDPGWIQGKLDKALQEARKRKEYALLRDNIETIRIENGTVHVTVKTRKLRSLPGKMLQ